MNQEVQTSTLEQTIQGHQGRKEIQPEKEADLPEHQGAKQAKGRSEINLKRRTKPKKVPKHACTVVSRKNGGFLGCGNE